MNKSSKDEPAFDAPLTDSALPLEKKIWTVGTLVYTAGGLSLLFFWLLFGDFAISLRDRSVGPVMTLMLRSFQASDTIITLLAMSVPAAIALFIGPIINYKSDHYRSRYGRRIPFLMVLTPIAAFSMIGLGFSPRFAAVLHSQLGARSPGLQNCMLIVFGILWIIFEFAVVTSGPIFNGLINDVVPRPVLGRFFGLFRAVSLIDGMIFNYWIIKHADHYYDWIFLSIGLIFLFGFMIMCFMLKEGEYPPVPLVEEDVRRGGFLAMAKVYFRECFTNSYYLWVFALLTIGGATFAPINAFSLLYAKSLGMTTEAYGKWIFWTYVCSLALAYPLGSLVDRFHALRMGIIAMSLYAVASLTGFTMIQSPRSFGWALLAHGILSGTYFTSVASLTQALFPKLKFGQFASAAGMLASLMAIGMGFTLGPVLSMTNSNYRLTYLFSGIFGAVSLALLLVVYHKFMKLGGPRGYVAPG